MIKIQDVLRAGHIKRWNIVNTSREQTLAEHLFNVALIAQSIADDMEFSDFERHLMLAWSLSHDIPEVVCGDTPTPTKKRMKDQGFDMESTYCEVDPVYANLHGMVKENELIYKIVKMADLIESVHFLSENGVGRHAAQVHDNVQNSMHKHLDTLPAEAKDKAAQVMNKIFLGEFYE